MRIGKDTKPMPKKTIKNIRSSKDKSLLVHLQQNSALAILLKSVY